MKRNIIFVFTFLIGACHCLPGMIEEVLEVIKSLQDPDTYRNVSELITSRGYPVEEHTVTTPDGYILSIQRIPHGRGTNHKKEKMGTVFLQHGSLSAGDFWLLNSEEQSPGYILPDEGYDVWLGNVRGTTYSRKHVKYTPDQKEFWNFSLDEMALQDLPTMIDYVLNATGEEKLYYVGHSQGSLIAFALLSEKPEYNDKMSLFVALAPVTYVMHSGGTFKQAVSALKPFEFLTDLLDVNELFPNNEAAHTFKSIFCSISPRTCEKVWFQFYNPNPKQMDETRWPVIWGHFPAGTSTKCITHYAQLRKLKKFAKFDYGRCNYAVYKQESPPEYDLSQITTPVALIASNNDKYADPKDVENLRRQLKSVVSYYSVPDALFNHNDFVLSINANKLVYAKVLSLFKRY